MPTGESNPHRRVIIDFEPGSQPINGVVREGGLAPRPFTGWLALMASLEAASDLASVPALGVAADTPRPPSSNQRNETYED